MRLNPRSFPLRPIHGPDIKSRILIEPRYSFPGKPDPGFDRDRRLQEEFCCRVIDTRAMEFKIGRNSFESPSTVEHHRAKPGSVGARAHDRHIAFMPISIEKRPGLRPALPNCHSIPPCLQVQRIPWGFGFRANFRGSGRARIPCSAVSTGRTTAHAMDFAPNEPVIRSSLLATIAP